MASEPVPSREVGNRTSRVFQPVMVISVMVAVIVRGGLNGEGGEYEGREKMWGDSDRGGGAK